MSAEWGGRTEGPPDVPGINLTPPSVEPPPSTAVAKPPRWVVPALIAMVVVTVASVSSAIWPEMLRQSLPGADSVTALRAAHDRCDRVGDLSDGDRTLFLDLRGEDAGSGAASISDLGCYLDALETPTYVRRHIDTTRALDGRQSETWGQFEASWTYHPDDGLDILIRQV